MPNLPPIIEDRSHSELPAYVPSILEVMFTGQQQVYVKKKYDTGLSGSLVFLVRVVGEGGPLLPAIVKFDTADRVRQEWAAYEKRIQFRLPKSAAIRQAPTCANGHGGLWYELIGAGSFEVVSLREFYQRADVATIQSLLRNLFGEIMGVLWRQAKPLPEFNWQKAYHSFLPADLVIARGLVPAGKQPVTLMPETLANVNTGDFVILSDFVVTRTYPHQGIINLRGEANGRVYKLTLQTGDIGAYHAGQIVNQITGQVLQTQSEALARQAVEAGIGVVSSEPSLILPNNQELPNPLKAISEILNYSSDVKVGYIHGDLNLENILIEGAATPYLIDFALAGQDHILRDIMRLEMSFVTQILAPIFYRLEQAASRIVPFYDQLHYAITASRAVTLPAELQKPFAILGTIRELAHPYLFKPGCWDEYYRGLFIYLLGCLRYDSLNKVPLAKQVAFYGAATILQQLKSVQSSPMPADVKKEVTETAPKSQKGEPKATNSGQGDAFPGSQNTTVIHGNVTGPMHTGSGDIKIRSTNLTLPNQSPDKIPPRKESFQAGLESFQRAANIAYEEGLIGGEMQDVLVDTERAIVLAMQPAVDWQRLVRRLESVQKSLESIAGITIGTKLVKMRATLLAQVQGLLDAANMLRG